MKNFLLLVTLLISLNSFAQSIDSLKLTEKEIPEGYKATGKLLCKSIQAQIFFENPDIYAALIGKVVRKNFQSFESKKDYGSALYFEFKEDFDGKAFLSGLLWGGDKPSKAHPEEFFVKKNILIIWSFDKDSVVKKSSKEKVSKLL